MVCNNYSKFHKTAALPAHQAYLSASFEPKSRERGTTDAAAISQERCERVISALAANARRLFSPKKKRQNVLEATASVCGWCAFCRSLGLIKTKASWQHPWKVNAFLNCPLPTEQLSEIASHQSHREQTVSRRKRHTRWMGGLQVCAF